MRRGAAGQRRRPGTRRLGSAYPFVLGVLVVVLNVAGAAAYLLAALNWVRAARSGGEAGPSPELSRSLGRGAAWAAVGVASDALSILAVFFIATAA